MGRLNFRNRFLIFLLGAIAGALVFVWQHRPAGVPAQRLAFWYWHTPFRMSDEEKRSLERMGVDQLFVLASTISNSEAGPTPILPQRWEGSSPLPVQLVVPFDRGIVNHFEELDLDRLAQVVLEAFERHRAAAEAAKVPITGLQLDFDCPTRLLPRYADLLRRVRKGLPEERKLSIAALATWLGSKEFRRVLEPLDFFIPQFYEGEMPKQLDDFKPVATADNVERGIRRAADYNKPYWIGLPAYGHALMFDAEGNLAGTLRGLSPSEAARKPNLEWVRNDALGRNGEKVGFADGFGAEVAVLKTADGAMAVYEVPSAKLVRNLLRVARGEAAGACRGIALFRFPEAGEELSVPLPALEAALRGKPAEVRLAAKWIAKNSPWNAIESPGGKALPIVELSLEVENVGRGPTRYADDSVEVTVLAAREAVESVEPGDADGVVRTAEGLRFRLSRLGPGDKATFGPIRLYRKLGLLVGGIASWADWEKAERGRLSLPEWKPSP